MKVRIAIFFTLLFAVLLTTPAVISLTDVSKDIAFFLDMNEEEGENKGKEELKVDSKLKIYPNTFTASFLSSYIEITKNVRFQSKNYVSHCPKIATPPPKLVV